MIAVVDAGLGNLRSVARALEVAGGKDVRLVSSAAQLAEADRVVVPGQGAFGDCARSLRPDEPLGRSIVAAIRTGKPYLGICLGLQVLFESSEEAPGHPGLGVYAGKVQRLPEGGHGPDGRRLKVPHMGWSRVAVRGSHPLLDGEDPWFYFVHSFQAQPRDVRLIAAVAAFGDTAVTAAVAHDNVFAVQFHPEKSQRAGLWLLEAFVRWKA